MRSEPCRRSSRRRFQDSPVAGNNPRGSNEARAASEPSKPTRSHDDHEYARVSSPVPFPSMQVKSCAVCDGDFRVFALRQEDVIRGLRKFYEGPHFRGQTSNVIIEKGTPLCQEFSCLRRSYVKFLEKEQLREEKMHSFCVTCSQETNPQYLRTLSSRSSWCSW